MPKTAATIESLTAEVAGHDAQIAEYEEMINGLPDTATTEPAREYFREAIAQRAKVRDAVRERLGRLEAEAAVERHREGLIKGFGYTNVSAPAFKPKAFSAEEAQSLYDDAELRIMELTDQSKLYKRAADTVEKMELSEEELKSLPKFQPVVDESGKRATLTLGRASSGPRTPRAAEVIVSVGNPIQGVDLEGAQVHGEPGDRPFHSSWYKMAKDLNEEGHFTEEQWAATQTNEGQPRQMSFKEFMVKTFDLSVIPLEDADPVSKTDAEPTAGELAEIEANAV